MAYLDALAAFATLMAVLSALVTTLLEAILRTARARQENLLLTMKKLDDQVLQFLPLSEDERLATIVDIVHCPARDAPGALAGAGVSARLDRLDKGTVFEDVSTEHVARRVGERLSSKRLAQDHTLHSAALSRVARKFEELRCSISADFKRRSRFYSIVIGVALAFAFNINGLEAFKAFLQQPDLEQRLQIVAQAGEGPPPEATLEELDRTLEKLQGAGIPIGPDYWPHCLARAAGCDDGRREPKEGWLGALAIWVLACGLTGAFMGFGAPFWFDVAKRASAVRALLGGRDTTSERLKGASSDGSASKRKDIVEAITEDAFVEETMIKRRTFKDVPDGATLEVRGQSKVGKVFFTGTLLDGNHVETQLTHVELTGGRDLPLSSAVQLYRLDLEILFQDADTASVQIECGESAWVFDMTGSKDVGRVICPIFMA